MPVSRLAKWKTAIQMMAIWLLLLGNAGPGWLPVEAIGEIGLWLAAALTLITGWDYLRAGLRHMRESEETAAWRGPPRNSRPSKLGGATDRAPGQAAGRRGRDRRRPRSVRAGED